MTREEEFKQRIQGIAKKKTEWLKDFVSVQRDKNKIKEQAQYVSDYKSLRGQSEVNEIPNQTKK